MYEALYFGTPVLGFGQAADQFGMIYRMKALGVAKFAFPEKGGPSLFAQMNEFLTDSEEYKEMV
jgi:UDP:flavonoid glycosyltransferase YjiC (YdhE family)